MSQLLLAKNSFSLIKQPLIIFSALLVNVLIFYLILKMVSNDHQALNKIDPVNFVDFINFQQKPKIEEKKVIEEKPEDIEEEKLPPPEIKQPEIQKPVQTQTELPTPNINLPISINGLPYIGDFLKSKNPAPVQKPNKPAIATNLIPTLRTEPSYPPRALRSGIQGVVTVEFIITEDGSVKDPVIIKAEPPKIFDRSVLRAIKKWKFNPNIVNGQAVEKTARQNIHFKLQK